MFTIKPTIKTKLAAEIFTRQDPSREISENLHLVKITHYMVIELAMKWNKVTEEIHKSKCFMQKHNCCPKLTTSYYIIGNYMGIYRNLFKFQSNGTDKSQDM